MWHQLLHRPLRWQRLRQQRLRAAVRYQQPLQQQELVWLFLLSHSLFAFNPEMLIVTEAGGETTLVGFGYLILRLLAMVYLLASATSRFDLTRLSLFEIGVRLAIGLALIHPEFL